MVEAKNTVEEMLDEYREELEKSITVQKIILYGSRARGDALKSSDIDLIVVSDDFKDMDFVKRLEFLELSWKYPIPLEALGYTTEEFEEMSRQICIVAEANRYGKCVYSRG
jgi:hypothetical protein